MSTQRLLRGAWKMTSSRTARSAMTYGLNEIILRMAGDVASKGRIVPEMNKSKLPTEIEARVLVSSDVKK